MTQPRTRCAIYTRKSTEDGLEQEFNSLDAQREACEAFILSQRHEGWELVPDHFDDGGCSGGDMKRSGLQSLLADVESGRVDVIVVYKVDRLTRSLADFAKIVEQLDAKGASFVSVTQAFNTTTSMGRLTLNVLLSFAQFEREVTGERIRDKIAASKKKGIWMGGPVPLGYQVIERKLEPVTEEAERVRTIMRRYVASSSTDDLLDELEAEGFSTKFRKVGTSHRGGIPFKRGSLFHLLGNAIYRGMIVHKGTAYSGEHEAIVGASLWEAVQSKLKAKAPPRKRSTNGKQDALLQGLLSDSNGRPMVPTFSCKATRRYRYYETRRDLAKKSDPKATRFAMAKLDRHVITNLQTLLSDEQQLQRMVSAVDAKTVTKVLKFARKILERLDNDPIDAIRQLISHVEVTEENMLLTLKPAGLGLDNAQSELIHPLALPSRKPFGEHKLKLGPENADDAQPDPDLIKLLKDAKAIQELVLDNPELPLNQLTQEQGSCRKRMTKLLQLSWLSPNAVEAILDGRQPASLSRAQLLTGSFPLLWVEQEKQLAIR
jgi:DNA invertase Pin-like site-specific DNA recombinase